MLKINGEGDRGKRFLNFGKRGMIYSYNVNSTDLFRPGQIGQLYPAGTGQAGISDGTGPLGIIDDERGGGVDTTQKGLVTIWVGVCEFETDEYDKSCNYYSNGMGLYSNSVGLWTTIWTQATPCIGMVKSLVGGILCGEFQGCPVSSLAFRVSSTFTKKKMVGFSLIKETPNMGLDEVGGKCSKCGLWNEYQEGEYICWVCK